MRLPARSLTSKELSKEDRRMLILQMLRFRSLTLAGLLLLANLLPSTAVQSIKSAPQDGPVSVTYGSIYREGALKIVRYELSSLPKLPDGYVAFNGTAYLITTTAVIGPSHVVHFKVMSAVDEETFRSLRIFHAEPDTFDPDNPMWVDRTIRSPENPAPNFSDKTIHATSDELGVFVIARRLRNMPADTAIADVAVTCKSSPESVTSPNTITYVLKVTNNGPGAATEVGLVNGLSPDGTLLSITASQGTCKEKSGSIYCKLGTLAVEASAAVKVEVKPYEGTGSFPAEGKTIATGAWASAKQADSNTENNSTTETTLVFPDPNMPPSITIDYPKSGDLFVGPADITIKAKAFDSDGTVAKVEFLDNGELIGTAVPSADNSIVITERNVSFGYHSILAVVTDNGGRQNVSNAANIIVNGSAIVKILTPVQGTVIEPGSNVKITAQASHPSGLISKLELLVNGEFVGEAAPIGEHQYKLELDKPHRALYSIVAVGTDGSGITTTSTPVNITVTKPPTVSIINPSDGALFPSLYNINITAKAMSAEGSIDKVDFYANNVLIGTARDVGTDQFMMTWRRLPDGVHILTAVATDELGVTRKSEPVKITVSDSDLK